mgnify:CR=1 FL=1|jgi:hypothetical protein|tara:strand:+ start:391 stop:1188 length:798 start_codon:yes stop_codon:yes gene_type:complete
MSSGDRIESAQSDPWDVAIPYIEGGFDQAKDMYNEYTPEYYSGETQAGFSPDQLTAQQGVRDFATQGAPQIMNPAMQAYQQGTSSNMLDVANNPYVNNMAQAAADRAMGSLTPQMANIRSGAIMSGGYGGGRQGIAEGNALSGAADSANQAAAGIYSDAYGQGLGHQANTLGQTGGLMNAGFSPYGALNQSGGQQQGREQKLIQDAMHKQQFEQNQPYDKLAKYQQGITGFSPLVGNAGQTVGTTPGASGMQNAGTMAQMYSLFM